MSIRDNLTEEEKQIYSLITAAKDQGIITAYSDDGKYISCKLDDVKYEICLGFNPDPAHPSAERAIRASRFVTRLMDKIRRDYSCYFVQSENDFRPRADILMNKINSGRSLQITDISESETRTFGSDCFVSSYEIEVEIVATVGDTYETMVDFLTVDPNDKGAVYTHNHIIAPRVLTKKLADDEIAIAQKSARQILDLVLDGKLPGENGKKSAAVRANNIRDMLLALSQSEDSRFRKFLDRVSASGAKVGQISVKPCSLLIDAVDEKEYVFKVSVGQDTGELSLLWRSNLGELTEDTALYLNITPSSEFIGLTNVSTSHRFDNFNHLVLAHRAEKKDGEIIVTPDKWTLVENKQYKNYINNYAVPVERNGTVKYFYKKYAQKTDGKWRLKAELAKCELTNSPHYKGDLEQKHYLKDGEIKFGAIYTAGVQCFSCQTCHKIIYFLGNDDQAYLDAHVLLDGKHYCDKCGAVEQSGNVTLHKVNGVINGGNTGSVYAKMNESGNFFLPVEHGGNVFVCANCGAAVLYDDIIENKRCDVCTERICYSCANRASGKPSRPKIMNRDEYACASCLEKNIFKRGSKFMSLYRVEDDNGCEGLVLDKASKPSLVFHCAECGKPKYFEGEADGKQRKCSACGRIICSSCMASHQSEENTLGLIFCKNCRSGCKGDFNAKREAAEKNHQKLREQTVKVEHAKLRAAAELKVHVKDNIRKYLPYMTAADRKKVKRSISQGTIDKVIETLCLSVSVLEKSTNFKFTLSVAGGKKYLFYRVKNKLTYGGEYNG